MKKNKKAIKDKEINERYLEIMRNFNSLRV